MCTTAELRVMVADSNKSSRDQMCEALQRVGIEQIVCAEDALHGLNLCIEVRKSGSLLSMLFCSANLSGMSVCDFIRLIEDRNKGVIPITYSKCIAPEAHILSLFELGSVDHIEQNSTFNARVGFVVSRWLRAAQLQCEYSVKYGFSG